MSEWLIDQFIVTLCVGSPYVVQGFITYHMIWDFCIKLALFLTVVRTLSSNLLPHTHIICVFTSAPVYRRPRYHDTASQRTLASSKMQTGYFSACMPACFRLLLMNHLARTHSFMYTRSVFLILKSREHVFLPGPYHLFPHGLKTQMYRKWNWSADTFSQGLSSVQISSIIF